MKEDWFNEKLYDNFKDAIGFRQSLLKSSTVICKSSKFQDIEIFDNPRFGRVLALDGVVQTTERDEFFYHEMFSHVPIFTHGGVESVLIIGGGDGGILREVLRHNSIKKVIMVEIDKEVIDLCREHMPDISRGSFSDKRATILVEDGIEYVKNTKEKFDIIIVDSTDPVNVGEVLFTDEFYQNAKKCLNKGGILSTQSGVPFLQDAELLNIKDKLGKAFTYVSFYVVPIPTYIGGFMTLSFATDMESYLSCGIEVIEKRIKLQNIGKCKYYNYKIHCAAFALPEYINNVIKR